MAGPPIPTEPRQKDSTEPYSTNSRGRWGPVYGELLTFDDPETRLPAIDRLEGFHPGGPSLYRRVLVPVWAAGAVLLAWLYTDGSRSMGNFRELPDGVWR